MTSAASVHLRLSQFEGRLLFSQLDNVGAVVKIGEDLQLIRQGVKSACAAGSLSSEEVGSCLHTAHNIQILRTCILEVRETMDELCENFSLKLHSSFRNTSASRVHPEHRSSSCDSSDVGVPIPNSSQLFLKQWSQDHMSYLFPTKEQAAELAVMTSMNECQVTSWFRNARARSGWSKLFAHKTFVNRDRRRLEMLLEEYHAFKQLHCDQNIQEPLASDEGLRLVDQVLRWFRTSKKCKQAGVKDSVKPWVQDVLFNTLTSFRRGTFGISDSSQQVISSLPSQLASNFWSPSSPSASYETPSSSYQCPPDRSETPDSLSSSPSSSLLSSSPASTCSILTPPTSSNISLICSNLSSNISDSQFNIASLPPQLFDLPSSKDFSSPVSPPTLDSQVPADLCPSSDTSSQSGVSCLDSLMSGPSSPTSSASFSLYDLISAPLSTCDVEAGQFDDAPEN